MEESGGWDDEYVADQILKKRKIDILKTYASDVSELRHFCGFLLLTLDIITHILSFVNRKDIYIVLQVCRSWRDAVLTKPAFWKRFVRESIVRILSMESHIQPDTRRKMSETFGTLDHLFNRKITMRQKYLWLFKDDWVKYVSNTRSICCYGDGITIEYCFKNVYPTFIAVHESTEHSMHRVNGLTETIVLSDTFGIEKHSIRKIIHGQVDKSFTPTLITWECDFGKYSGEAHYIGNTKKTEAHGDGKWILKDGRVIEGKGVAWNGEPRMKVELL